MNAGALAGLVLMIVSEGATLAGNRFFAQWNTPICWTGFILFADSIVHRVRGRSWLRSSPGEFIFLAVVSIPLWLVFEFYNLYIRNWNYVGLPTNMAVRYVGYAWSFATIWPAIFEGAELVAVSRSARPGAKADGGSARHGSQPSSSVLPVLSIAAGAAMLIWPLVRPSQYLAAPVWLGFILLLDPINFRLGLPSLLGDIRRGEYDRLTNLVLSGFLCGILWEFWNYWSTAKWHYTVPIMEHVKIFEMPVPGYFGFPAFALECFTMYVLLRAVVARHLNRTIAL